MQPVSDLVVSASRAPILVRGDTKPDTDSVRHKRLSLLGESLEFCPTLALRRTMSAARKVRTAQLICLHNSPQY